MKAALLRPLYPAVGGFVTVYADTDEPADVVLKRWQAERQELALEGVREATLDAVELVLTDPDLSAPAHAVIARDGRVVGTIAVRAAQLLPLPAAQISPLPQLRFALADAPALDSVPEARRLAVITGIDSGAGSAVLAASSDAAVIGAARSELGDRLADLLAGLALGDADSGEQRQAPGGLAAGGAVHGVAETMAALREGRAEAVFLSDHPALADAACVGPAGTELAVTSAELAEAGLLAPLRERTDEAIIRAAATTDAELFVLAADDDRASSLTDGVGATLRRPATMS